MIWVIWAKRLANEGVLLVQGRALAQEDGQLQHIVNDLGEDAGEGALLVKVLVQDQAGIQEDGQLLWEDLGEACW